MRSMIPVRRELNGVGFWPAVVAPPSPSRRPAVAQRAIDRK
jgi:hypothetical protein